MNELDRILASDTTVTPSTGFTRDVMRAVRQEAYTPPPIPFPWGRVLIGGGLTAGVLVSAASPAFIGADAAAQIAKPLQGFVNVLVASGAPWIAGGALLSYLSVKLSLRIAG